MNAVDHAAFATNTAEIDAARLLLARMGLSARDLLETASALPSVPTFAEYVPVVSAAVGPGTRRLYSSYWNRILDHWAERRLDPTPSDIKRLVEHVRLNVVARRNARGGRGAGEHLIAALRCLYRHAEHDGLISGADNPAAKVAKPRRLPSTAARSPTPGSPRSTTSPRRPATIPRSTPCCCDCTSRPPADAAAPSPCVPGISIRPSA